MSVIFWTVVFQEKGSQYKMPVYEDTKEHRYWLGGSAGVVYPLLFSTAKAARKAIERIEIVEGLKKGNFKTTTPTIWKNGSFKVSRASIDTA